MGKGACFDFPSSDGAGMESCGGDDEFLSGVCGCAATGGCDGDEDVVDALLVEM